MTEHPSYSPMFNHENTPTEFGYVGGYPGRPPGTGTGFSGQEPTPRYDDDDGDDDDGD